MPPSHPAILTFHRDDKVASWFNKTLLRDRLLILREWFNSWICPNRWHATCRIPDNVSRKVFPSVICCARPKQELDKFPSEHPTVPLACLYLSFHSVSEQKRTNMKLNVDAYEADTNISVYICTYMKTSNKIWQKILLIIVSVWPVSVLKRCSQCLIFYFFKFLQIKTVGNS